ncbi:MAG: redoxin domain-containing protein [Sphingopyxis sp.]
MNGAIAPEWTTTQWINSEPLAIEALRGRIVVMGTFQMLCPGCVSSGLPQLQRIEQTFDKADVAVVGLHTVFEHHAAMMPVSLEAFLHEYRITFPVGVDAHDDPRGASITMRRYGLRGTPSLVMIDRAGRIRHSAFGMEPDIAVGARIAHLVGEASAEVSATDGDAVGATCSPDGKCE